VNELEMVAKRHRLNVVMREVRKAQQVIITATICTIQKTTQNTLL